jgi:hypothetical protein
MQKIRLEAHNPFQSILGFSVTMLEKYISIIYFFTIYQDKKHLDFFM